MKRSVGKKTKNAPSGTDTAAAAGTAPKATHTRRWIGAAAMVVVVFAAAGAVGAVVRDHSAKKLTPPTSGTGPSHLAVPVSGHTPVTLTLYEDLRDPASATFEQTYRPTMDRLLASGTVKLLYREVADVDAAKGGTGSLNAANALGCAQDAGHFSAYRTVLLANQPSADTDAFADKAQLIALSKQVKKLDTDVFRNCVDSGAHNVWVKDSTSDFASANLGSVPVLTMQATGQDTARTVIGGSAQLTPEKLFSLVIDAATTATPSATPSAS
ncbi:DsbA family protein [Streptacidiphilus sp. N1-12]|uniref:DsbA family protein n=2 Tax=Streptacidiphilus alkalitolerans TaxID=3342712 RepID=A0ABV6WS79_9ACTN